jgi:hypothetical protein
MWQNVLSQFQSLYQIGGGIAFFGRAALAKKIR